MRNMIQDRMKWVAEDIPPAICRRWSKQRRYDMAWRLIRDVKPSETFDVVYTKLEHGAVWYEQLANGNEENVQIVFAYDEDDEVLK